MLVSTPILLAKCVLPTEVTLGGTNIAISSKLNILGVIFNPSLNFTDCASVQLSAPCVLTSTQIPNFLILPLP